MENTLDIDNLNLTTLEMLYHMHQLDGVAVVGDPAHAFATYSADKKALYIFCGVSRQGPYGRSSNRLSFGYSRARKKKVQVSMYAATK
jgi:hypothetical protein